MTDGYEGPWCVGRIKCAICGHESVDVWPACVEDIGILECAACGQQHSVLIEEDDDDDGEPWQHHA